MAADEDKIYILMREGKPVVAHTRLQGAAMGMATNTPEEQQKMWVAPIDLVQDGD